jgi:hypothetical protein
MPARDPRRPMPFPKTEARAYGVRISVHMKMRLPWAAQTYTCPMILNAA